jgi:hypothetical protein
LAEIKGYPRLKVCVSTRDTYKDIVVDSRFPGYAFTHPGFNGREFQALQHFAQAYGLQAEITPLFSDEVANPLFLHLACKTLHANGVKSLDLTLKGFLGLFEGYLELCNARVRARLGLASPGNLIRRAMLALASPGSVAGGLPWSDACAVIGQVLNGEVGAAAYLQELHNEGLIIIASTAPDTFVVRFGYQKYGDVLRCLQLLETLKVKEVLDVTGLSAQIETCDAGMLEAFASVLPELEGIEITELGLPVEMAHPLFVQGLIWRTKESINLNTECIFRNLLTSEAWPTVFETALKFSLVPDHNLNASWIDWQLRIQSAATRDGFLWHSLRTSYDDCGVVKSLVDAALLSDISLWPAESRRLATITLGWLCSSPDRRVRDQSTKGLVRLIQIDVGLAKELASHFDDCDDQYVLESVTGAIYGACLLTNRQHRKHFADSLDALLTPGYDRPNAVIRDNVRLLAAAIGIGQLSKLTLSKLASYPTKVPLPKAWPTELQAKALLIHGPVVSNMNFMPGPMEPDFWRYKVTRELTRFDLKAAGITAADVGCWLMFQVTQLGFPGKNEICLAYDGHIASTYGQGRGRNGYAERLGKKYSWIAFHELVGMLSDNLAPAMDWSRIAPPK